MRLSTAKIQKATAQKKTVRLFDGSGLYLEIAPTGSRIKPPELLSVLRRVESRGVLETAHRLMNYCGNIYR